MKFSQRKKSVPKIAKKNFNIIKVTLRNIIFY